MALFRIFLLRGLSRFSCLSSCFFFSFFFPSLGILMMVFGYSPASLDQIPVVCYTRHWFLFLFLFVLFSRNEVFHTLIIRLLSSISSNYHDVMFLTCGVFIICSSLRD
jgi:hypothetical protein